MASRRSSTRKRRIAIKDAGVKFGGVRSWIDEFVALLLFAAGMCLALSFVSYQIELSELSRHLVSSSGGRLADAEYIAAPSEHVTDRNVRTVLSGPVGAPLQVARSNWIGPLGHLIATLSFGAFGWGAMLLVAILFWGAWTIWNGGDFEEGWYRRIRLRVFAGLVFVLLGGASALGAIFGKSGGGEVGLALYTPIRDVLGGYGAGIFAAAILLTGTALMLGRSIPQTAIMLGGLLARLSLIVAIGLPRTLRSGVVLLVGAVRSVFSSIYDWLDSARHSMPVYSRSGSRGGGTTVLGKGAQKGESLATQIPDFKPARRTATLKDEIQKTTPPHETEGDDDDLVGADDDEIEEQKYVVVQRRSNRAAKELKDSELKRIQEARESAARDDMFANYKFPPLSLLVPGEESVGGEDDDELREKSKLIELKLGDFGIEGRVTHVHPGPVITLFEFEPAPGVKVGRIAALGDDLAMSLKASSIRIIAPIPRRGTVGIEVPNRNRDVVRLRDVLESRSFAEAESILAVPVGKDTYGEPVVVDIASMPHLLMAGATGTGKSVCINSILVSLLYRASPADLGLILIDPKILELSIYEGIPHLRVPVVTVPRQAKAVLDWAVKEMNRRYRFMQRFGVRNIDSYNKVVKGEDDHQATIAPEKIKELINLTEEQVVQAGIGDPGGVAESEDAAAEEVALPGEKLKPLPKIVIVIDELADLMLTVGREIEEQITKLAQKARAAGIHLILATQRPSVDVVTGLIKANFPARISFRVTSRIDSRTILDSMGSERLLGKGDMLFMLPGAEALRRVHGAYISDAEVKKVVDSVKASCSPQFDQKIIALCEKALQEDLAAESGTTTQSSLEDEEYDEMYDKAVEFVVGKGQASTSMIQRAFRIGYNRAARLIDRMEREGVVGPMDGARPRGVLVNNLALGASEQGEAPEN